MSNDLEGNDQSEHGKKSSQADRAPKRNLMDLFSALRGTALDLTRDHDTGRELTSAIKC